MSTLQFSCPKCGSKNVQVLLMSWYRANDVDSGPVDEMQNPELYNERFWCDDCDDHVSHLIES